MTDAEWPTCKDAAQMLEYLKGKASARKLRLFACACVRPVWHLLADERSRLAVEMAERYAERKATRKQVVATWEDAVVAEGTRWAQACPVDEDVPANAATWCAYVQGRNGAWLAAEGASRFLYRQATIAHIDLLRCVFGNPFRSSAIQTTIWLSWNDGTIPKIAQSIYDECAFDRMPILADALEDARCDNADILAHCREPGEHVRGCWVVDLLLGKS